MTVFWDWNGTLLDDTHAAVAALSGILRRRSLPPVGFDEYRATFAFPARDYYARVGLDLESEDWDALAREYHDAYLAQPKALARDAAEALDLAASLGFSQTVVSAMEQGLLESEVARYRLAGRFDAVRGTGNLDGGSKIDAARALARRISAAKPGETFAVVGDSLHDKETADAIGAACILYSGGSHAPERLRPVAPVADSLAAAVRLLRQI